MIEATPSWWTFFEMPACHSPVLDGFNQHFQASVHFPRTITVDKSQQYWAKFLGTPRIEPVPAGWEVRMLPPCYGARPSWWTSFLDSSESSPRVKSSFRITFATSYVRQPLIKNTEMVVINSKPLVSFPYYMALFRSLDSQITWLLGTTKFW